MPPPRLPAIRFGLVAISLALLLALPGAVRAEAEPPARLLSPQAGGHAVPGSLVAIAWEPAAGLAALPHVEEWEAFLSLDGGATYPLRLTPHLDASRRHFLWQVPNLPTSQARLLLRFGDERREIEMEAGTFTIAPARGIDWEPPPILALRRGEHPRPGDPGVVGWVEGPRDGSWLRPVAASAEETGLRSAGSAPPMPLFLAWPAPARSALAGLPPSATAETPADRRAAAASQPTATPPAADVRLLIHRFNE